MTTTTHHITCRYGVAYFCQLEGTKAAKARTVQMLQRCCCWVCHNRDCKEPRNEKLQGCGRSCSLYTREPYCKRGAAQ